MDSHGYLGKITGNLPDGHIRGVALANALSPSQCADVSGPTAVIRSITKLDHTLLEAQKSPEIFRDLVVRVSGFSAYFVDLDKVVQDEIIARTEHFVI